jgi:hypothetical protein
MNVSVSQTVSSLVIMHGKNCVHVVYAFIFQIMNIDVEHDKNDSHQRDVALRIARFLDQSQIYLNRLPALKLQLNDINQLQQFDTYVQTLSTYCFSAWNDFRRDSMIVSCVLSSDFFLVEFDR